MDKRMMVWRAVLVLVVLLSGTAYGAEVGLYRAAADGGRTAGELAIRNTLSDEGIEVSEFSRLSLDNLLRYRVVIIPNTRTLSRNEDPRWVDNLRAYVVEAGGALVFCHDAIGAERAPFGNVPLFPEIVMTGTVERSEVTEVRVALPADPILWDFEYLQGYTGGQTAEHMYFDRFMFAQSGGTPILVDPETGKTVVGTGEVGRGRVVFNGMLGGHPITHTASHLEGVDRDVMVNTVRWALAGRGLVVASPGEMEVARWSPAVEDDAPAAEQNIALVFGDHGDTGLRRHVAEENLNRAGIDYDYIPFNFLAVRGLDKKNYPVSIIFLPGRVDEAEFEVIKSYLESGGRAIIFLSHTGLDRGGTARLMKLFSCEGGRGYRNTHQPEIFGRFRRILFTDPDHLPARIDNLPRILSEIRAVSDDARVIAYWEDIAGEIEIPAVVRHEYGYLFNNNSFGDLHNLRMFLANAVVELAPGAGGQIYSNLLELYRERMEEVAPGITTRESRGYISEARRLERAAEGAFRRRDYRQANASLVEADKNLVYAYAASMPSVPDEKRLVFAAHLTDPEETFARLAGGGLQELSPIHVHGMYPSELHNSRAGEDRLREWIEAARLHNLKFGVTRVPFRVHEGSEVYRKAIEENWKIVTPAEYGKPGEPLRGKPYQPTGRKQLFPDVCHSAVSDYAIAKVVEVARNYPVNHIMLDYIRWPNSPYSVCVCDHCRERFQKDTKIRIGDWPDEALGKYRDQFNEWRAEQITRVVREISRQVKAINPDIKIGIYTVSDRARAVGQHWWDWGSYVDYSMPMIYTNDLERARGRSTQVNEKLGESERARLVPCIGVTGYNIADPLTWLRQIDLQRELAPEGIMFFHYAFMSDPNLELLRIGPYRKR